MLHFGTASAAIVLTGLLAMPCARAAEAVIIVQRSPLAGYAVAGFYAALVLTRRRLLK